MNEHRFVLTEDRASVKEHRFRLMWVEEVCELSRTIADAIAEARTTGKPSVFTIIVEDSGDSATEETETMTTELETYKKAALAARTAHDKARNLRRKAAMAGDEEARTVVELQIAQAALDKALLGDE